MSPAAIIAVLTALVVCSGAHLETKKFPLDTVPEQISLDGRADVISIADSAAISQTTAFTVCGFFTLTTTAIKQGIVCQYDWGTAGRWALVTGYSGGTSIGRHLTWFASNAAGSGTNAAQSLSTANDTLNAGQRYHFAIVYNGAGATNADKAKIYIDGADSGVTFGGTWPSSMADINVPLEIGRWKNRAAVAVDGSVNFGGDVEKFQYFSTNLGPATIASIAAGANYTTNLVLELGADASDPNLATAPDLVGSSSITLVGASRRPLAVAGQSDYEGCLVGFCGDSITAGSGTYDLGVLTNAGGYRGPLWNLLVAHGYRLQLFGSQSSGPDSLFDKRHEGYPGQQIATIQANVLTALARPEVIGKRVILVACMGANDAVGGAQTGASIITRAEACIRAWTNYNSLVEVLWANLLGYSGASQNTEMLDHNSRQAASAVTLVGEGRSVELMDWKQDFPTAASLPDGIHPGNGGYVHIAGRTFTKLKTKLT